MAVGYWSSIPDSPGVAGLAERWNGSTWKKLTLPASDYGSPGKTQPRALPLTEIWNGAGWR
jgi:hypothetical protein